MVQKPISYIVCLLLLLAPGVFAQDEEAAPKISLSFADDVASEPAAEPASPAPAITPTAEEPGAEPKKPLFTEEEQLFLIYAWYLVFSNRIDMIDLSEKEKSAFLVGINLGLQKQSLSGWEDKMPAVTKLMDDRWQPVYEKIQRERKAQTVELFSDLAQRENVKKTSTGLYYELVSEGTGKFPTPESAVNVEFTATLVDGTVFETSEGRDGPVPLTLANMVPGVREGLLLVREGGIIKLWVPASLGFGSEERSGIPADSALIFDFTLHEVGTVTADQ